MKNAIAKLVLLLASGTVSLFLVYSDISLGTIHTSRKMQNEEQNVEIVKSKTDELLDSTQYRNTLDEVDTSTENRVLVEEDFLTINPDTTVASDIISIAHRRNEAKIIVTFKKFRKCNHPQLIGRLSGRSLSKLTWEEVEENDDSTILVGYYDVPRAGKYFIEIIVTMCEKLKYDTDFSSICLEEPSRHRLTEKSALIQAVHLKGRLRHLHQDRFSDHIGAWYELGRLSRPLYTRYQPQGCRSETELLSLRCEEATEMRRFYPFAFNFLKPISLSKRSIGKHGTTVCFVGCSHAIELTVKSHAILREELIEDIHVERSIFAPFASDINEGIVQTILEKKCSKVVVGTGQWDAGNPGAWGRNAESKPTLFPEYEEALEKAMSIMSERLNNTNIDIYFRSTQ